MKTLYEVYHETNFENVWNALLRICPLENEYELAYHEYYQSLEEVSAAPNEYGFYIDVRKIREPEGSYYRVMGRRPLVEGRWNLSASTKAEWLGYRIGKIPKDMPEDTIMAYCLWEMFGWSFYEEYDLLPNQYITG